MFSVSDKSKYTIAEVIDAIVKLYDGLAEFWGFAKG